MKQRPEKPKGHGAAPPHTLPHFMPPPSPLRLRIGGLAIHGMWGFQERKCVVGVEASTKRNQVYVGAGIRPGPGVLVVPARTLPLLSECAVRQSL